MASAERPLRVALRGSDAPEDRALAHQLRQHLQPLERFAGLTIWDSTQLSPGVEAPIEIDGATRRADIVLLLLSPDFMASTELLDVEVPRLLKRHASGDVRLIPVLLRSCLWDAHLHLRRLRPLPDDGRPIASFQGEERDRILAVLARRILQLATRPASQRPARRGRRRSAAPGEPLAERGRGVVSDALRSGHGTSEADIAIIIATSEELAELSPTLARDLTPREDSERGGYEYTFEHAPYQCVVRVVGGMGSDRAPRLVERFLSRWSVATVVWLGVGAALQPDTCLGDVFVANQVDAWTLVNDSRPVKDGLPPGLARREQILVTDPALLQEMVDFPHAHPEEYAAWQEDASRELLTLLPGKKGSALRRSGVVRAAPVLQTGPLATCFGLTDGDALAAWLKTQPSELHALEVSAAGLTAAATEQGARPRTLILRGICDARDERRDQIADVADQAMRRAAMRNAVRLFSRLLTLRRLPLMEPSSARTPAGVLLRLEAEGGEERAISLHLGRRVDLGRHPTSALVLPASDVKAARSRHVLVSSTPDGVLVEVMSKNGIIVNGGRYGPGAVLRLATGQSFFCGETEIFIAPEPQLASTATNPEADPPSDDHR